MPHLWVRSESRANERRVGITPDGVQDLRAQGFRITVEDSPHRILPIAGFADAGAEIAAEGTWPEAPSDAIVFGLKELPEDGRALRHRHIMFGHAYKGQPAGQKLLQRFRDGGGTLYDLEYLTDEAGRRLAAFGYWAGYAGAAVSLSAWAAQRRGGICGPVQAWPTQRALNDALRAELDATGAARPHAIIIGALGRVGSGASDLLTGLGVRITKWDMAETASGGPFPEILIHELFINCILAGPKTPVFLHAEAVAPGRALTVIGDVACDPSSDFNPIKVYDRVTDWAEPVLRVAEAPVLDVMAIDNLPSLLPRESSLDFAAQLLPVLRDLDRIDQGPWGRAQQMFAAHRAALGSGP
ncbi:saccharopine dehydrogenase [Paracoccus lutimaris]|uniref:Saccharopine dehydrogenase [NAD(+), L-lysine-forming] n=1 Tax=Paracoccus lutimaris TaxID=1490030 RepID=A0A368ZAT4_9RHOB|nr:saccharopine dehydrogenase [Paracoccus lutimaris]RCW88307.1 saccharopine dehydrogenase (NAD+, L-lysine-forming) [Paracoccus lutimaris]